MGGYEVDIGKVIDSLNKDIGLGPGEILCEAIRSGNDALVLNAGLELKGAYTLSSKKQAILEGRADLLKLLLLRDDTISEAMITAACERKDRECIRVLLDFGWPIDRPLNSAASLLWSVIHLAAIMTTADTEYSTAVDDEDLMQWLIQQGADVNATSRCDESVLSVAIAYGSMEVIRLLLASQIDVGYGDLLHCATQRTNQGEGAELVELLVAKYGANVNAYRFDNPVAFRWRAMSKLPTPLHIACDRQNIPVARALLRHGADPHRKMLEGGRLSPPTPLERAMESNDQDMIHLMESA